MNRAQALSKLNRSDMRNAAAERGMQRLFTWNRASEHRSMYSYVRLSIDRCTATYV